MLATFDVRFGRLGNLGGKVWRRSRMGGDVVVGGAGVSVVRVSTPDPVGVLLLSAIVADLVAEGCLSGAFGLVDFPGDCGVRDSWVLDGSDCGGADWWRERFWDLCEDVERGGVGDVSPECSYGIVVAVGSAGVACGLLGEWLDEVRRLGECSASFAADVVVPGGGVRRLSLESPGLPSGVCDWMFGAAALFSVVDGSAARSAGTPSHSPHPPVLTAPLRGRHGCLAAFRGRGGRWTWAGYSRRVRRRSSAWG